MRSSGSSPSLRKPRPLADCAPFDADGNPVALSECPCSNNPQEQSFCLNASDYLVLEALNAFKIWLLSMLQGLAKIYWLLARVIVNVADFFINNEIWTWLRESVFQIRTFASPG